MEYYKPAILAVLITSVLTRSRSRSFLSPYRSESIPVPRDSYWSQPQNQPQPWLQYQPQDQPQDQPVYKPQSSRNAPQDSNYASNSSTPTPQTSSTTPSSNFLPPIYTDISDAGQQVLVLLNAYRKSNRLQELAWDAGIFRLAQVNTLDQAKTNNLHHSSMSAVMDALNLSSVAENVAMTGDYGFKSAQEIGTQLFNQWKGSPPHNANMLSTDVTVVGISVIENSDTQYYSTMLLGRF